MDRRLRKSLLYDFYGPLLTGRQRDLFRLYDEGDLSLGEIAERIGVSRQAVHDILKRAERSLQRYESKLGLVARHIEREARLQEVRRGIDALRARLDEFPVGEVSAAVRVVKEELGDLDRLLSDISARG